MHFLFGIYEGVNYKGVHIISMYVIYGDRESNEMIINIWHGFGISSRQKNSIFHTIFICFVCSALCWLYHNFIIDSCGLCTYIIPWLGGFSPGYGFFLTITVTSEWARLRLKSQASPLFTQSFIRAQIKENIKAPRHWPLCGEFTGDRWIPRTNGQ